MSSRTRKALPGAWLALALLLAINLFNYIDRQVLAAVQPRIAEQFFGASNPHARAWTGWLPTAFLLTYMLAAPIFGRLADRTSRWLLVGISVILWSLASGASGLATGFAMLLITRLFVGIGEAGYGPAAPTLISDLYPLEKRGQVMAWFYMAIPVGSALGYVLGGLVEKHWGWRWAFFVVVPPGLLLGLLSLLKRDPPRGQADDLRAPARTATWADYTVLLHNPSYVLDTAGMAAMTFAIGGISYFMPDYLVWRGAGDLEHVNLVFGAITAVTGITATLLGGIAGDALRQRFPGSYFLVSAAGIWLACPLILLLIVVPFPGAWVVIFFAVFFLFFNTGPSNTILANVTHPSIRASAFAINIFIIHALGDAISPPILGAISAQHVLPNGTIYARWNAALVLVALVTALAGAAWLLGARHLAQDTAQATRQLD